MTYKIRTRHSISPISVAPGDLFRITLTRERDKKYKFEEKIGQHMVIDTIITFDCTDILGLSDGVGCIFGKAIN